VEPSTTNPTLKYSISPASLPIHQRPRGGDDKKAAR
jgi:hypothetical protein